MSAATSATAVFESNAGSVPGPVDAVIAAMPPNSWKALPGTKMKDVCPLPYNEYFCSSVTAAWSGGAYDELRERMVIIGGGHSDSWYNNVFAFDLVAMKWNRLTEMAAGSTGTTRAPGWDDQRTETCGYYPKGTLTLPANVIMDGAYIARDKCFVEPVLSQLDLQQPRSAHTYGGVFVDRINDRYCNVSDATYYPSAQAVSRVAVCLNPVTGLWSRIANLPATGTARGQTALDAAGHVWNAAGEHALMAEYDPNTNVWKTHGDNNYDAGGGTDIDRRRNHLYVLFPLAGGAHSVRRWDLGSTNSLKATPGYTEIATSGDVPRGLSDRPGFVYADSRDRFYAWGGGRDIYVLNPATATWQRFTGTGDDPGPQLVNGNYGRFRYSPSRGVFVLVNYTTQDVLIYKPAD